MPRWVMEAKLGYVNLIGVLFTPKVRCAIKTKAWSASFADIGGVKE